MRNMRNGKGSHLCFFGSLVCLFRVSLVSFLLFGSNSLSFWVGPDIGHPRPKKTSTYTGYLGRHLYLYLYLFPYQE